MIRRLIVIAVNALCLIAFIVCLVISSSIRTPLRSQQAADAWRGQSGERFSQLSVFFPETSNFDDEAIRNMRNSLDRSLLAASLETTQGRTLYTDAWSSEIDISIRSERERNPVNAKAIAVGGDFFLFHPLYLRDGSYLSPDDVMKDRIVLDEELAWRLFGATSIAGFEVMINNKPFKIAGVISRENDSASSKAYTYGMGLFISYEAYMALTEGSGKIKTYEIVLPDPITGFAKETLTESVPDSNAVIVENTNRFSLGNSFSRIGSFGERSMRSEAIAFPYWENAARLAEDWLALILVISLIFLIFPVVCAVFYLIILIRFGIRQLMAFIRRLINKKDNRAYEKYLLEHHGEQQIYDADEIIREFNNEIY